jgi:hypothetical protein
MENRSVLATVAATCVTLGGGWMALSDNALLLNAGLVAVAMGFAVFLYLLFENRIKSVAWERIGSALKAYCGLLRLLGSGPINSLALEAIG